jgi:hypothetical protein
VFYGCTNLISVYFKGNPPTVDFSLFSGDNNATVYYLPGTTGWSSSFASCQALLWNPLIQTSGTNFGMRNNQFGFNIINNTADVIVVVEACTNLTSPVWVPLTTNTLVNGLLHFSEPFQANTSGRYYGLGLP